MRRADPNVRRFALVALVAAAALGVALIGARSWYSEPVANWLLEDPALTQSRGRLLLLGAGALLVFPLGLFAVYFWRLGSRVVASREFPPEGMALVRDTEIITGDAALAHGRGLKALAIILVIGMAALGGTLWRIAQLLTNRS
jgi:hypothetical protein